MKTLEELKNLVIGKKLSQTMDVDFGTCYPVVSKRSRNAKNPKIIGVVCAEFGSQETANNGYVAWAI